MADYRLVDIEQLEADLTTVADAIRDKAGDKASGKLAFPMGMAITIGMIPTDITYVEDALVARTLTTYTNENGLSVGKNAFLFYSGLTAVSFLKAKTIGEGAFQQCFDLKIANFPEATDTGEYAFYDCSSLTEINFPKVSTIRDNAFGYCGSISVASFPLATAIGYDAFGSCHSLNEVAFPKTQTIGQRAFESCSQLSVASFPAVTRISSYAFYGCTNLQKIYILSPSVCTLGNSNVFSKAGITSSTGSIFVPASLVNSYKTKTNWTYFSNRIFAAP